MSGEEALARIARDLLHPGGPALAPHPAYSGSAKAPRVFVAARHDVVVDVLSDEPRFSLALYDELLEQVAPGTRYLVGCNDANRQLRLRLLMAAQAQVDRERCAPDAPGVVPNLAPGYRTFIAAIAREEASAILTVLAARARLSPGADRSINFVREYAFLLAYRMAWRIVGVAGPARPPALVRIAVALRNLFTSGAALRLKGELGTATSTLTLLHPLVGHVFSTVTTSPRPLQWASRVATRTSLATFDAAWEAPGAAPEHSLLPAMLAVRGQFAQVDDANFHLQARSVLFELTGALALIVGKSLAEIAGFATSDKGRAAGVDWFGVVNRLADPVATPTQHDATINELLRLGSGQRLVRTVAIAGLWRGMDLQVGDRILAMVDVAAHDPAAFPNPERFAASPTRPYITSGPLQGPHVCYGRMIAWTILREAIVATRGQIVPMEDPVLKSFAGLPDDLRFTPVYA
ncbi:hypothetical protein OVA07_02950 [Novosphingobium sp. SL115]|uniref:hypothetical protein n=1 Tax=Novosphingobium sp. SL115 TaxID=2995150 RepID=UPI002276915B|nr:hypothetical protein [Novosphingobium sp. SL115]MCY1669966.1 hypothetical protein [Novosphingobium sp. SL115]